MAAVEAATAEVAVATAAASAAEGSGAGASVVAVTAAPALALGAAMAAIGADTAVIEAAMADTAAMAVMVATTVDSASALRLAPHGVGHGILTTRTTGILTTPTTDITTITDLRPAIMAIRDLMAMTTTPRRQDRGSSLKLVEIGHGDQLFPGTLGFPAERLTKGREDALGPVRNRDPVGSCRY